VKDYDAGLEYADAAQLLDLRQAGTERTFLVQWADGRPDSWEPEDGVSGELIEELKARRPELFGKKGKKARGGGGGGGGGGQQAKAPKPPKAPKPRALQPAGVA